MKKFRITVLILALVVIVFMLASSHEAMAFAQQYQYSNYEPAGFFSGIWNGLLAPWTLIARWFIDGVVMYAIPNTGWFYDLGFLIGIIGSIPIGWLFAILSVIGHIFFF